ncbi:unnamed protein product [Onchocerca flexuosa]|uniref:Intraflagellar transport protein 122 homolog n=1 Tax=Onchocerca flexuosa TaxID=387005 RepID=A0A183HV58_9BILA|nr:unnamed protein product [Onchocerca flexuosa]
MTIKVQAVEWHPAESSILLTGTLSSQVGITDCRKCDTLCKQWEVSGEVERLTWNHFSPFYFFVVTDNGHLYYMDTRKNEPVISKKVHEGGARSVVQSYYTKDLLSTCGEDGVILFLIKIPELFFVCCLQIIEEEKRLACFTRNHNLI